MVEQPDVPANASSPEGDDVSGQRRPVAEEEDARIAPASLAWFLGSVLLIVLSFIIYKPIIRDGWTRYDNMLLIAREPKIQDFSVDGIREMFTSYHHDLYQPLLTFSLAIDHALNRRDPNANREAHWPASDLTGWHLHSWAVHVTTMVLLFLLIGRMTGNVLAAWLGTALVALHPLVVEPVSWLICRTFLLAGFWIVLGCHFYLSYARRPRWWLYVLSLFCFGVSMLAKLFMGIFLLPLVFDLWCRRRNWVAIVLEKLPILVLVAVLVYFNAQRMFGAERLEPLPEVSVADLISGGLVGTSWTVANTFFPRDLSVFYGAGDSAWSASPMSTVFGLVMMAVVVLITVVVLVRKRIEVLLCVVGWFVLFVPLLAALRVRETITADRYAYVPLVMCALLIAWLLSRWFNPPGQGESVKLNEARIFPRSPGGWVASVLIVLICGWLLTQSRAHAKVWSDDVLLWEAAVARTPHRTAYGQLANALITKARVVRKDGDMDSVTDLLERAEAALQAGLELSPEDGQLLENYGALCITRADDWKSIENRCQAEGDTECAAEAADKQGERNEQALELYRRSVEVRPVAAGAWNGLGVALLRAGRFDEAREAFSESLRRDSGYATAIRNLAAVLRQIRRHAEAAAARNPGPETTDALRTALNEEAEMLDRLGRAEEAAEVRSRAAALLTEEAVSDDPATLDRRAAFHLKAAMDQFTRAERLTAPSRIRNATAEQQEQFRAAAAQAHEQQLTYARNAERDYRQLILLDESSSAAWEGLAQALFYQQRMEEADEAFSRAVELDAGNVDALAGWARMEGMTGNMDRAVDLLNRAVQAQPDHESALFDLFRIHYSQQRVSEATEAMEALNKYYPANGMYRQLLRQLYEAQGRTDDAARLAQPAAPGE